MAGMTFAQYGRTLIRNPAQRLPASQSIPGLQRMGTRILPQVAEDTGVIPQLGKMAGAFGKVAPVATNIKLGYDLANKMLEGLNLGSWAHPRKAY